MELLALLKPFASLTTIVAAILVASNLSPRIMIGGFATFVVASIAWIAVGLIDGEPSLYMQNVVLLGVNFAGIYRWLPKANADGGSC